MGLLVMYTTWVYLWCI